MDLTKSRDFFDPHKFRPDIHVIGCGSVGSALIEQLARLGITDFTLYDFDTVDSHNIANQMFFNADIGQPKVTVCENLITKINPDAAGHIITYPDGYTDQPLSGYVFLCVDSIELRRKIVESNLYNTNIIAMFDFRTGLTDADHYAANWSRKESREKFLNTMKYSDEEANADTPVSACGVTLSVASTIRAIVAFGVTNFMNFVSDGKLKQMISCNAFTYIVDAF